MTLQEKIDALIGYGLAEDKEDARAKLEDMGELEEEETECR